MAKAKRVLPPQRYLLECLTYKSDTGELHWNYRPKSHFLTHGEWTRWNGRYARKPAGTVAVRGYYNIGLRKVRYLLHRVIWKLMTGNEPPETIDHIDGNTSNNRWNNLRPATMVEQGWNVRKSKANTSGYRGVSRHDGKWEVYLSVGRTRRYLGRFDTKQEAAIVYQAAARKIHGGFYRSP